MVSLSVFVVYWRSLLMWFLLAAACGASAAWLALSSPFKTLEYQSTLTIGSLSLKKTGNIVYEPKRYWGIGDAVPRDLVALQFALNSDSCLRYMERRFELIQHYGLDCLEPEDRDRKLVEYYQDKVSVGYNPKMTALEVSVWDPDPLFAARMANAYADYADSVVNALIRLAAVVRQRQVSVHQFDSLAAVQNARMAPLRQVFGVYNVSKRDVENAPELTPELFAADSFHVRFGEVIGAERYARMLRRAHAFDQAGLELQQALAEAYRNHNERVGPAVPRFDRQRPDRPLYTIIYGIFLGAFVSLGMAAWITYRSVEPDSAS
jgi:hypothetical protein